MNFTCTKCRLTQPIQQVPAVDLDLEEKHRIWGATCSACGFSGKSQVSATVWKRLKEKQDNQVNLFDLPALLTALKKLGNVLGNAFRLPSLTIFRQE